MSFMTETEAAKALLGHYRHPAGVTPGGFCEQLIVCFEKADPANTLRLMTAFPEFARPVRILQGLGADALAQEVPLWEK